MEILNDEKIVKFDGIETEDIIPELVTYLKELNGDKVIFNLEMCEDLHTGVLQPLGAYSVINSAEFIYNEQNSAYKMALESFHICD
jgi:hypothetical protein